MKQDDISREIEALFKNARPLSKIDLEGLAEANRALSRDPKHIAGVIKAVFVNDVVSSMKKQGISKSQLADQMGYTRQYLTALLSRQDPRNFTIDTVVKLSMAVGLRPECIRLEPMEDISAQAIIIREKPSAETSSGQNYTQTSTLQSPKKDVVEEYALAA